MLPFETPDRPLCPEEVAWRCRLTELAVGIETGADIEAEHRPRLHRVGMDESARGARRPQPMRLLAVTRGMPSDAATCWAVWP